MDVVLWVATVVCHAWVQPSSRRMVNLTYGLWMLSTNLMQILQCMLLDMILVQPSTPTTAKRNDDGDSKHKHAPIESEPAHSLIIEAVNKNSLPFFLLVSERACTHPHPDSNSPVPAHIASFVFARALFVVSAISARVPSIFRCTLFLPQMRWRWQW